MAATLTSFVNFRRDNAMSQFSIRWILTLNCLSQKARQVHSSSPGGEFSTCELPHLLAVDGLDLLASSHWSHALQDRGGVAADATDSSAHGTLRRSTSPGTSESAMSNARAAVCPGTSRGSGCRSTGDIRLEESGHSLAGGLVGMASGEARSGSCA